MRPRARLRGRLGHRLAAGALQPLPARQRAAGARRARASWHRSRRARPRRGGDRVTACPECARVYWPGQPRPPDARAPGALAGSFDKSAAPLSAGAGRACRGGWRSHARGGGDHRRRPGHRRRERARRGAHRGDRGRDPRAALPRRRLRDRQRADRSRRALTMTAPKRIPRRSPPRRWPPRPGDRRADPAALRATTYQRDLDNRYPRGRSYGRADNPTVEHPKRSSTRSRAAPAACCSPPASPRPPRLPSPRPGDHVIAPKVMYWGLRQLAALASPAPGASRSISSTRATSARSPPRSAPGATKLVWLETPANPTWAIADIAAAAASPIGPAPTCGRRHRRHPGAVPPARARRRPRMHSATKYLNGHSDVVAGALVTARADDLWARIAPPPRRRRDPRPLRGLAVAARPAHAVPARRARLRDRPPPRRTPPEKPERGAVLYPGLPDHPGHEIAARQMQGGFGGMLSIRVKGGEAAAIATAARSKSGSARPRSAGSRA